MSFVMSLLAQAWWVILLIILTTEVRGERYYQSLCRVLAA